MDGPKASNFWAGKAGQVPGFTAGEGADGLTDRGFPA